MSAGSILTVVEPMTWRAARDRFTKRISGERSRHYGKRRRNKPKRQPVGVVHYIRGGIAACGSLAPAMRTRSLSEVSCPGCLRSNAVRLVRLGFKAKHRPDAEPGRVSAEVLARKIKKASGL